MFVMINSKQKGSSFGLFKLEHVFLKTMYLYV